MLLPVHGRILFCLTQTCAVSFNPDRIDHIEIIDGPGAGTGPEFWPAGPATAGPGAENCAAWFWYGDTATGFQTVPVPYEAREAQLLEQGHREGKTTVMINSSYVVDLRSMKQRRLDDRGRRGGRRVERREPKPQPAAKPAPAPAPKPQPATVRVDASAASKQSGASKPSAPPPAAIHATAAQAGAQPVAAPTTALARTSSGDAGTAAARRVGARGRGNRRVPKYSR